MPGRLDGVGQERPRNGSSAFLWRGALTRVACQRPVARAVGGLWGEKGPMAPDCSFKIRGLMPRLRVSGDEAQEWGAGRQGMAQGHMAGSRRTLATWK